MRNNFVVIDFCSVKSLEVETNLFTKLVQSLEVEMFKQWILR